MAKQIIKGDELMLFVPNGSTGYKSIAYATSHTLTMSAETVEVNSKDHGAWGSTSVNKISWSISTENLYTEEDYDVLFDWMVAKTPITVVFGKKAEADDVIVADDDAQYYTPANGTPQTRNAYMKTGKVLITSLVANTPSGENATFTAEFQGIGALSKQAIQPEPETDPDGAQGAQGAQG